MQSRTVGEASCWRGGGGAGAAAHLEDPGKACKSHPILNMKMLRDHQVNASHRLHRADASSVLDHLKLVVEWCQRDTLNQCLSMDSGTKMQKQMCKSKRHKKQLLQLTW